MGYKKCPRCELNWIKDDENLCDVCKAELKIGGISLIDDDEILEESEERICPVCKINLLDDGEEMCAACREEALSKVKPDEKVDAEVEEEDDDSWREFVEDDAEIEPVDPAEEEIMLGALEDEELENDEDIEEEEVFDDVDTNYDYDEEDLDDEEELDSDDEEAEDDEDL